MLVANESSTAVAVDVDSGAVTTDSNSLGGNGSFVVAISGSFGPSPDIARRGTRFFTQTFPSDFGAITGFDIRGTDGMTFVAREATRLSGTVLETGLTFPFSVRSRALIGGGEPIAGVAYLPNAQAIVFALTLDSKLLSFAPTRPSQPAATVQVTGVRADDTLLAIDFRTSDNMLYGLSDRGRIYTINPTTGAATLRSTLVAAGDSGVTTFENLTADIAFSPISGLLRINASDGRNLRANVDTGAVMTDAKLTRSTSMALAPKFAGAAFVRGLASSLPGNETSGKLLLIDKANQRLAALLASNAATDAVRDAGPLSREVTDVRGFDVVFGNGYFVAATPQEPVALFRLSLVSSTFPFMEGAISLPQAADVITGFAATSSPQSTIVFHAVINQQDLISFARDTLQAPKAPRRIVGMAQGESVLSIDSRSDNQLFGLGSAGNLYVIDATTGIATLATVLSGATLRGTRFEMDFDPVTNELAVASDAGQLLTMKVAGDATEQLLSYAPLTAVATAYTNSVPDAGNTQHYFLDTLSASIQLYESNFQNPFMNGEASEATDGSIATVGPINPLADFRTFTPIAAFDITAGDDALSLAALQPLGEQQSILFRIEPEPISLINNLQIGPIGPPGTAPVRALAIRVQ